MGGSQSASRSLQGLFTPEENSAEFFGFFAISGKFASVLGPLTDGTLIVVSGGDTQGAIVSILPFLVAGLILMFFVNESAGREQKQNPIL